MRSTGNWSYLEFVSDEKRDLFNQDRFSRRVVDGFYDDSIEPWLKLETGNWPSLLKVYEEEKKEFKIFKKEIENEYKIIKNSFIALDKFIEDHFNQLQHAKAAENEIIGIYIYLCDQLKKEIRFLSTTDSTINSDYLSSVYKRNEIVVKRYEAVNELDRIVRHMKAIKYSAAKITDILGHYLILTEDVLKEIRELRFDTEISKMLHLTSIKEAVAAHALKDEKACLSTLMTLSTPAKVPDVPDEVTNPKFKSLSLFQAKKDKPELLSKDKTGTLKKATEAKWQKLFERKKELIQKIIPMSQQVLAINKNPDIIYTEAEDKEYDKWEKFLNDTMIEIGSTIADNYRKSLSFFSKDTYFLEELSLNVQEQIEISEKYLTEQEKKYDDGLKKIQPIYQKLTENNQKNLKEKIEAELSELAKIENEIKDHLVIFQALPKNPYYANLNDKEKKSYTDLEAKILPPEECRKIIQSIQESSESITLEAKQENNHPLVRLKAFRTARNELNIALREMITKLQTQLDLFKQEEEKLQKSRSSYAMIKRQMSTITISADSKKPFDDLTAKRSELYRSVIAEFPDNDWREIVGEEYQNRIKVRGFYDRLRAIKESKSSEKTEKVIAEMTSHLQDIDNHIQQFKQDHSTPKLGSR